MAERPPELYRPPVIPVLFQQFCYPEQFVFKSKMNRNLIIFMHIDYVDERNQHRTVQLCYILILLNFPEQRILRGSPVS